MTQERSQGEALGGTGAPEQSSGQAGLWEDGDASFLRCTWKECLLSYL